MADINIFNPVNPDDVIVRGYSPEAERWVIGSIVPWGDDYRISGIDPDDGVVHIYSIFKETITNYTGHKDRNGEMMFTGDILNIDYLAELMYIYTSSRGIAELAPVNYVSKGQSFSDSERLSIDLSKDNITQKMEITGTVLQSLIPNLMENYKKTQETPKILEDDEEFDFEDGSDLEEIDYDPNEVEIQYEDADEAETAALSDLIESDETYRGLSISTTEWVTGVPHFTEDEAGQSCNMIKSVGEHMSVTPVIPDSICIMSPFKDKNGVSIFSGDIVLIENKIVMVFNYSAADDVYCVIMYNMYNKTQDDNQEWDVIDPDAWDAHSDQIEVIGDIYIGFMDSFTSRGDEFLSLLTGLAPIRVSPGEKKNKTIYEVAEKLDNFVHSINRNIIGWYMHDINSTGTETIVNARYRLPKGYEIRAFLNASTYENTVHFGKYGLGKDKWKQHGVISYSRGDYSSMIDSMCNIMSDETMFKSAVTHAIKFNPNKCSKDYHMLKHLTYDNILEKQFSNAESISQKNWMSIMKECYSEKSRHRMEIRAQDCCGMWMHGFLRNINGNYYLNTSYEPDNPIKAGETVDEEYLESSLCLNTWMIDSYGKFIYSSDIVRYEGIGDVVIYATNELDPNDVFYKNTNSSGFQYMYWMKLDDLNAILKKPSENSMKWTMINPAEWIRNRDRLTVVGNMIDMYVESKDIILNSKDIEHDPDPMQLVFPENDICYINEDDVEDYFDSVFGREIDNHETIYEFINVVKNKCERFSEISEDEMPVEYRVYSLYDETPVIQFIWEVEDEITLYVYLCEGKCSVLVSELFVHNGMMQSIFKDISVEKAVEIIADIYDAENIKENLGQYSKDLINEEIAPITEDMSNFYTRLIEDEAYRKEICSDEKKFIEELRKSCKYEKIMDMVRCRALNKSGETMFGIPIEPGLFLDVMTDIAEPYIEQSLSFNTWMLDASGMFIFDYDNCLFNSESMETVFTVLRKRRLTLNEMTTWGNMDCDWNEYVKKISEEDNIMRCVTSVLCEKMSSVESGRLDTVQWVPFDRNYFFRNAFRIIMIGDIIQDGKL